MIERLRRGAQSGLSYILIGVLIVFFAVFFGVPADGCMAGDGQRTLMASVNGDDIHTEDVNTIQNRYFRGERTTRTRDDEFYNRQAEALKIVITTHLLAQKAEEAGLRVSDEEFADYITDPNRNIEFLIAYGRTGQFDGPYYERWVQHGLRVPIPAYEEFKRRELLARKYLVMLDMQAHATPDEIEELNQIRNTRVNLEYVKLDEDSLIDVLGLTDEQIDEFLASEEGGDRVADYFEANRADYEEPEEINLRTIRIAKPSADDATEAELQDALDRFQEARRRVLDEGEDFGTVAEELSEDFYAGQGGLRGWNTPQNTDQDLADAVDGVDVGEIREIETDHAHILVKLEDRREEQIPELEEFEREIAETLLRRDLVDTRGAELAEALLEQLRAGLSLEDALQELEQNARDEERESDADIWASLEVDTTGFFNLEGEQAPDFGPQAQFAAQFGRDWDEVPGIGNNRDLAISAFDLTEDNPLIDDVVEHDDARLVVRLLERQEPDEELTASDQIELELEARAGKVGELLGPWRRFFDQPTQDYGHYIESVFNQAMEDGSVRLYERNSRAAGLVRQMVDTEEEVPDDGIDFELGDELGEDLELEIEGDEDEDGE